MEAFAKGISMEAYVKGISMKTISQITINNEIYRVQFNGSKTYMVVDNTDTAIFMTDTIRKITNFLKKL